MKKDRLLVVDDDASFLDLMSLHLSNNGYEVERALSGKEALHVMQASGPFQILVTDLMMPGVSGLELLRRAKEMDPKMEVIVITAAGSLEMAISALREDGAFDYLTKPLDMISELSLAVERASEHRKLKLEREDLRDQMISGAGRLKAILTHTGDAILAVNEEDEVIVASPSILKLMTKSAQNGSGNEMQVPPDLKALVADWQMLGSPYGATIETAWPEDELQAMVLSPLSREKGEPAGWVMMLHQISERKILERYLIRRFTRIEKDLHQPLRGMKNEISSLSRQKANLDPAAENSIRAIERVVDKSIDLLDELQLGFFPSGYSNSEPTRVTLPLFVENERKNIGPVFQAYQSIKPVWEIEDGLHQLEVELQSLHTILHLLLQRATVLGDDRHRVKIAFWHVIDDLWVEISDIGPGSGALEESSGFSPSPDLREDWLGKTEIQLAIVKSLVSELNGQVWHYLNFYGGSTVAVRLPL